MESLFQDEIEEIKDENLQLRYLLGTLNRKDKEQCPTNSYWNCDIRCDATPVNDDKKLLKVLIFIKKHNLSVDSFFRLLCSHLKGNFCYYDGDCGELIRELDYAIKDYEFVFSKTYSLPQNDYKEKELLKLILRDINNQDSSLNILIKKYSLTITDFMVLAKTSLIMNWKQHSFWERKDLFKDLKQILDNNNLYDTMESVLEYRKDLKITETDEQHEKSLRKSFINKFRKR
ncbi:MAG: hypothetical protein E7166_04745 [Firmicutes bacterium]|nr:hypothetical protein [Bacillota bacterium]